MMKTSKQLRPGYTTGTCAAVAAKAAAACLLSGICEEQVMVLLPDGQKASLKTQLLEKNQTDVTVGVIKDAGDDPDITNGMMVIATVSFNDDNQIVIDGGKGVGRVTKPGLDQPVGAAAINSVPREMIQKAVLAVMENYAYTGGMTIVISLPDGERLAEKTLNPTLGITGGLSILGTSGIVWPMSEAALIDTIEVEIRSKIACGQQILLMAPGNYGLDYWLSNHQIDTDAVIKISNFIGQSFDLAVSEGAKAVVLAGHIGKLIKISGGIMNTHSKEADARMELLAIHALRAGADKEAVLKILEMPTTDAGLEWLFHYDQAIFEKTMTYLIEKIEAYLYRRTGGSIKIGILMFSQKIGLLGQNEEAMTLVSQWKKQQKEN